MNQIVERVLHLPITGPIARIALTFPFWSSGLSKLMNFDSGVAEMAHFGLKPAAAFNIATVIVQLAGSLLIILRRHAWLGAAMLAVFTMLTIPVVHHFWSIHEEPFRTIAFHTATEHLGIIGGLLTVAILSTRTPERSSSKMSARTPPSAEARHANPMPQKEARGRHH